MRAIVSVIALVLATGIVMPIEADARAPRRVEKWGCIFVAKGVDAWSTVPEGPFDIYGLGSIKCPGGRQRLTVTVSVFQDIDGGPNLLLRQSRYVRAIGPSGDWLFTDGITCVPDGVPPAFPYFQHMKVKRKGQPGAIAVTSRNTRNPCAPFGGPIP